MLLSSGWGWKEAPSGPVKPSHAECSWGCTAGLGDESKAVGCVPPTALLSLHNTGFAVFAQHWVGLWILTWIKERECGLSFGLCTAPFSQKGAVGPSERDKLRPPEVWWPLCSRLFEGVRVQPTLPSQLGYGLELVGVSLRVSLNL